MQPTPAGKDQDDIRHAAIERTQQTACQEQATERRQAVCQVSAQGQVPEMSSRQLDIGRLLATGAKDDVIARRLGLSVRTVRSEIKSLVAALGATSRFQAGCELERLIN